MSHITNTDSENQKLSILHNVSSTSILQNSATGLSTVSTIQTHEEAPPSGFASEESSYCSTFLCSIGHWLVFIFTFGQCNLFPQRPISQENASESISLQITADQPNISQTTLINNQFIDPSDTSQDALINRIYNILYSKGPAILRQAGVLFDSTQIEQPSRLTLELLRDPKMNLEPETGLVFLGHIFFNLLYSKVPRIIAPPDLANAGNVIHCLDSEIVVYKELMLYGRNNFFDILYINHTIQKMNPSSRELFRKAISLIFQSAPFESVDDCIAKYINGFIGSPYMQNMPLNDESQDAWNQKDVAINLERRFVAKTIGFITKNYDHINWNASLTNMTVPDLSQINTSQPNLIEEQFIDDSDASSDVLLNRLFKVLSSKPPAVLQQEKVLAMFEAAGNSLEEILAHSFLNALIVNPKMTFDPYIGLSVISHAFVALLLQRSPLIPCPNYEELGLLIMDDIESLNKDNIPNYVVYKEFELYGRNNSFNLVEITNTINKMKIEDRELFRKVIHLIALALPSEEVNGFVSKMLLAFFGTDGVSRLEELEKRHVAKTIAFIVKNYLQISW